MIEVCRWTFSKVHNVLRSLLTFTVPCCHRSTKASQSNTFQHHSENTEKLGEHSLSILYVGWFRSAFGNGKPFRGYPPLRGAASTMSVQSYHKAASCELCEAYLNMCAALFYWVDVCETRGRLHSHNHYFSYAMELVFCHAAYNKVVKCRFLFSYFVLFLVRGKESSYGSTQRQQIWKKWHGSQKKVS